MFKIFEREYLNCMNVLSYQILGDVLYILLRTFDERICNNDILKIVKINMRKRENVVYIDLLQYCAHVTLSIMDERVYVRKRDNVLSVYNVKDICDPVWSRVFYADSIITLLKIKNKVYHMCGLNGGIINIIDPVKGDIFLKIKFKCDEASFVYDTICTITKYHDTVTAFDEYVVFYSIDENFYIKFNVDTKEYVINKISNTPFKINNKYYLRNYSNRVSYFYHSGNKVYCRNFKDDTIINIPDEFLHKCELNNFVDINSYIGHFKYNDVDHYFTLNEESLCIYSDISITVSNVVNENKIIIGSRRNKIEMCHDVLVKRSGFVADFIKDMGCNKEIISDSLNDIGIYRSFIYDDEVKHRNLYKLLSICNFLHDVDINYVAELVIRYVEGDIDSKISLNEAYEYLNLLHKCLCPTQMNRLTYLVFKKYGRSEFVNIIMGSISDLNNYLIRELIVNI